ncbi:MAG: hypothetical protein ABIR94_18720 [Rubrivivax sp.]
MHLLTARDDPADDQRRRWLLAWLALGGSPAAYAQLLGQRPAKLPPEQSVYRSQGLVTVNEQPASGASRIAPGDTLRTGRDSELVFVVGTTAMLLRADSELQLQGRAAGGTPAALKLASGRLLAVFAPGQRSIQTSTASVRISGTGLYAESRPDETYFCTCYGTSDVTALDDPTSRTHVTATYHDRPLLIVSGARNRGQAIRNEVFKNHTDVELALIEALVGRSPPFVLGKQIYDRPRPTDTYRR